MDPSAIIYHKVEHSFVLFCFGARLTCLMERIVLNQGSAANVRERLK